MFYTITEILKSKQLFFCHWVKVILARGERLKFGQLRLNWTIYSSWVMSPWSFIFWLQLSAAHTVPFGEAILHSDLLLWGVYRVFKISTHFMVRRRNMNTCIAGGENALFNTTLLHQLTLRFHSAHYWSSRKFRIRGLVGRAKNHIRMMHLTKLIRSGDLQAFDPGFLIGLKLSNPLLVLSRLIRLSHGLCNPGK